MNAQAHTVLRTATSYLPEAVAGYLRLPRDFADNRPRSSADAEPTRGGPPPVVEV